MPAPAAARPRPGRLGGLKGPPPKRQRGPARQQTTVDKPTNRCPNPDCSSPDIQEEDGVIVCRNCFTQIAENHIVAEVTFEENAGGRATVQGGTVADNSRHAKTLGAGAYRKVGGGERNSIADIQNAGRRALGSLCPRLGVADTVTQQAEAIWALAASINFSAGRKTDEVAAACLYGACRRQKDNQILLMDIAELLQINVFRLGEVYKDLCKGLMFWEKPIGHQHMVELEPLIKKYCDKLQFADKTKVVAEDALKIIRRMNRDWIVAGRHPAGLCGACIILAARMNNFQRSVREVVYVSKVADVTIAKRVEEFRRTKAAGLTVEQFRKYANRMKHQHDPPSMNAAKERDEVLVKRKRKRDEWVRQQTEARESRERQSADGNVIDVPDDATDASSRLSSVDGTPAPDQGVSGPVPAKERQRSTNGVAALTPPATQRLEPAANTLPTYGIASVTAALSTPDATQETRRVDADGFAIPDLPASGDTPTEEPESPPKRKRGRPKKETLPPPVVISSEELAEEDYLEKQIEEALENGEVQESQSEVEKAKEEQRIKDLEERSRTFSEAQSKLDNDKIRERREALYGGNVWDMETDDLAAQFENDPEVENCILQPHEVRIKEQIWVAHNEDWLRKQAEKEMLAKVAKATGQDKKGKKGGKGGKGSRKKRTRMGDGSVLTESSTPIETPADATRAMLEKRAPQKSQFVDFNALTRIYARQTPSRASSSSPDDSGEQTRDQSRAQTATPVPADADDREEGEEDDVDHTTAGAQDDGGIEPAFEDNPARHVQAATWEGINDDPEDDEEEAPAIETDEFGIIPDFDDEEEGDEYE